MPLYDEIGKGYDITRRADPYIAGRLAHHLKLNPSGRFLDIACGTGNYTVALSQLGGEVHGLDVSKEVLTSASKKESAINWCLGDVAKMPLRDAAFNGVSCVLGIHHFPDIKQAFKEAFRVISRGRFVIFTGDKEQMDDYWLNYYFPETMERSIGRYLDWKATESSLKYAGFKNISSELYEVQDDLKDGFVYCGKHRPEIYLDPKVRKGMSTFAAAGVQEEIVSGCKRLETDIRSGRIKEVIASYEERGKGKGDYMFVVAEKA